MRYHRFPFVLATLSMLVLNPGGATSHAQTLRTEAVAHKLSAVIHLPPQVLTFEQVARNPTVYNVMNGPNEFFVVGSLRTWSVIDRLHKINVPTLIISGRHDEATPACVQPYKDNIRGAKWEIFEQSSHMPHIEEKEKCMKLVGAFLAAND